MADIKPEIVPEIADAVGHDPINRPKLAGDEDRAPRIARAEKSLGTSGAKSPYRNSNEIVKGKEPYWALHHANSQGLAGQTSWEHKGSKRGAQRNAEDGASDGPQQHQNPWSGLNTDKTNALNQTY